MALPTALRRKKGLDKLPRPLFVAEESEGGRRVHPAATVFMRNIPKAQIQPWTVRAEAAMRTFHATEKVTGKCGFSSTRASCSPR